MKRKKPEFAPAFPHLHCVKNLLPLRCRRRIEAALGSAIRVIAEHERRRRLVIRHIVNPKDLIDGIAYSTWIELPLFMELIGANGDVGNLAAPDPDVINV